jgi:hypothetical protein
MQRLLRTCLAASCAAAVACSPTSPSNQTNFQQPAQVVAARGSGFADSSDDLEGHGRTALRETPMTHEKLGDDVAAVLRHLRIWIAWARSFGQGPEIARLIEAYLDEPTSTATQFSP